MSQGLREMLANRRFAALLIGLLVLCLIGLLAAGFVIIFRPGGGDGGEPTAVADTTLTAAATAPGLVTFTPTPARTATSTPRPSPTMVPVGTQAIGGTATGQASPAATSAGTPGGTTQAQATVTPSASPTLTPSTGPTASSAGTGDEELAQTGVGWGMIIFASLGLAALAVVARRLRLA